MFEPMGGALLGGGNSEAKFRAGFLRAFPEVGSVATSTTECYLGYRYKALAMDHSEIITIEPGKMGGKPCIRGLRITVYDVLDYLASGMTEVEILHDFPDLTREDIRACLSFAADRERKLACIPM
jgi:uncharacterized protein (DUF433 family)